MRKCTYKIHAESSFLTVELEVSERQVTSTLRKINRLQKSYVKHLQRQHHKPPYAVFSRHTRRYIMIKPRVDVKALEGYEGLKVSVEKLSIN